MTTRAAVSGRVMPATCGVSSTRGWCQNGWAGRQGFGVGDVEDRPAERAAVQRREQCVRVEQGCRGRG